MIELQTYSICYPDENHRRNLRGSPDFPDLFFIQLIHNQMKAKQHLENEKCELIHIGLVRSIIYALYPLRSSRQMTESYLNRYCYADMRTHAGIDAPLRENEVEPDLAASVRLYSGEIPDRLCILQLQTVIFLISRFIYILLTLVIFGISIGVFHHYKNN